MRKHFRLLSCTGLVPVSLLLAMGTGVAAQGNADHADMAMNVAAPAGITRTVNWSDASAWPSGKVPAAGEEVTIPRGTEVVLDLSPPALRSVTVQGKLTFASFAEEPITLTTAAGVQQFAIDHPPHVQQPLIQTIVDELNGAGLCPSTGVSGARTSWVMDQFLQSWRVGP